MNQNQVFGVGAQLFMNPICLESEMIDNLLGMNDGTASGGSFNCMLS